MYYTVFNPSVQQEYGIAFTAPEGGGFFFFGASLTHKKSFQLWDWNQQTCVHKPDPVTSSSFLRKNRQ